MSEESRARPEGFAARLANVGSTAQVAVPGLYAWAVTVAPAAFAPSAPLLAKVGAVLGVMALAVGPLVENLAPPEDAKGAVPSPRPSPSWTKLPWSARARALAIWGFVLSSLLVWVMAPTALAAAKFDVVRGALGLLGWALFAFACAGPARKPLADAEARITVGTPLAPRSSLSRGDGLYVAAGVLAAASMQLVGWNVAVPERAILVHLVTSVAGIAVVGASTSIGLARHAPRVRAPVGARLRRTLPWLVLFVALGVAGALLLPLR